MIKIKYVEKSASFPLFTSVSAGFPSPASDYEDKKISLDDYCIQNRAATFFITVAGDSMDGAGIFDGDLVVVDRSLRAKTGDVIVALVDSEFLIKILRRQGKLVYLAPANPEYPPLIIEENTRFEVWGVVTNVIRRLK